MAYIGQKQHHMIDCVPMCLNVKNNQSKYNKCDNKQINALNTIVVENTFNKHQFGVMQVYDIAAIDQTPQTLKCYRIGELANWRIVHIGSARKCLRSEGMGVLSKHADTHSTNVGNSYAARSLGGS